MRLPLDHYGARLLSTLCSDAEKTIGLSLNYIELEEPSRAPRWSAKVCPGDLIH